MVEFLSENVSVVVAVLLLAICPMVESKIAIPCALSVALWGAEVLSPLETFFLAFFGSLLPCIFILFFSRAIKKRTIFLVHEKFMTKFERKHGKRIQQINGKTSTLKKCLSISLFVAVPLPLTGVWTGSLIAGLVDLKIWQAALSVAFGEAISCAVMLLLCVVFENSVIYILLASILLIVLYALANFFLSCAHKKRKEG